MFLCEVIDNQDKLVTFSKDVITKIKIGDNAVKVFKLHGSNFKVLSQETESYQNSFTQLTIGDAKINFYSLDIDLVHNQAEPNLGNFFKKVFHHSSQFPALVIFEKGETAIVSCYSLKAVKIGSDQSNALSFSYLEPCQCVIYLQTDSAALTVEGSNLIYVDAEPVSGTTGIDYGAVITLHEDLRIVPVNSEETLKEVLKIKTSVIPSTFTFTTEAYPCVISSSNLIRPARLCLRPGSSVNVGREPSNDIWVAAPHVSRIHCKITLSDDGETVEIEDCSTNGTKVNGIFLEKGKKAILFREAGIIDLGKNFRLGLCFSRSDESVFFKKIGKNPPEEDAILNASHNSQSSSKIKTPQTRKLVLAGGIILIIVFMGLLVWSYLL